MSGEASALGASICEDSGAEPVPSPESYDIGFLDERYERATACFRNIGPGGHDQIYVEPVDGFLTPVAWVWTVHQQHDPMVPRALWILQASIRGCLQFNFQNPVDTIPNAVTWVDAATLARRENGSAWPLRFGTFASRGTAGSSSLRIDVGNPYAVTRPAALASHTVVVPQASAPKGKKSKAAKVEPRIEIIVRMPEAQVPPVVVDGNVIVWGIPSPCVPSHCTDRDWFHPRKAVIG